MIVVIKGKKHDLAPHEKELTWLLVPPSAVQTFRDLGIPLFCPEDGITVLQKADLWKRLSQDI